MFEGLNLNRVFTIGLPATGQPGQEKADKPKLAMQLLDLALCTLRPGEPLGKTAIGSRVLVVFPGLEQLVEDRVDTDGYRGSTKALRSCTRLNGKKKTT